MPLPSFYCHHQSFHPAAPPSPVSRLLERHYFCTVCLGMILPLNCYTGAQGTPSHSPLDFPGVSSLTCPPPTLAPFPWLVAYSLWPLLKSAECWTHDAHVPLAPPHDLCSLFQLEGAPGPAISAMHLVVTQLFCLVLATPRCLRDVWDCWDFSLPRVGLPSPTKAAYLRII